MWLLGVLGVSVCLAGLLILIRSDQEPALGECEPTLPAAPGLIAAAVAMIPVGCLSIAAGLTPL